jgi:hypothetical protein
VEKLVGKTGCYNSGMKINITVGFPESRWEDYKKIRIQALHDVPQAFLDDIDRAEKQEKSFWIERAKKVTFAEIDGKVVGIVGFFQEERTKQKHIANWTAPQTLFTLSVQFDHNC